MKLKGLFFWVIAIAMLVMVKNFVETSSGPRGLALALGLGLYESTVSFMVFGWSVFGYRFHKATPAIIWFVCMFISGIAAGLPGILTYTGVTILFIVGFCVPIDGLMGRLEALSRTDSNSVLTAPQ